MRKKPLELSSTDRHYLEAWRWELNSSSVPLLELDRGKPITTIAETLGVSRSAVSRWAKHYRHERLQMLHDQPRD